MTWSLAVDIGGTFTDVQLVDRVTGEAVSVKVPTTPADPSIAFGTGAAEAMRLAGIDGGAIDDVRHATTIATNTILEGTGARAALVTTRGFRYVLEIGRHDGPRRESLLGWSKPRRPIPPERVLEITERVAPDGTVEVEPDPAQLDAIVTRLVDLGVESVAVALIDAYAEPANERRVADHLRRALPNVPVSVSSDLLPTMREYERSMVAVLDAVVQPTVGAYLDRLDTVVRNLAIATHPSIMQSTGGLATLASIASRPVRTMLSGPAATVVGGVAVASTTARVPDVITFDVGGTSTDVALVRSGAPELTEEGRIGPWPLALPMLDIHTVGAGGGSIARADGAGAITVGPRSAGAIPGPAAYGRGGLEPTVTDAHVVLGRLPDTLAGGAIRLDRVAAESAIRERIADPLGLTVDDAALGILAIIEDEMAAAVRLISIERGHDPAAFTLVAGGGAGPLHAVGVARVLGIRGLIVPARPGLLSTVGLLDSVRQFDTSRTFVRRADAEAGEAVAELIEGLLAECDAWFEREEIAPANRVVGTTLLMRYPEQPTELAVPWTGVGEPVGDALARAGDVFAARHEERYGYRLDNRPVELAGVRVAASAFPTVRREVEPPVGTGSRAPTTRLVHTGQVGEATPVIPRDALPAGTRVEGPAVIEQPDATTWLPRGAVAIVALSGALEVTP